MFVQKKGEKMLTEGGQLGDLGNELEGYGRGTYITKYCSGGAKNYAYELAIPQPDGTIVYKEVRKLKGISLDFATKKEATLQALKGLVDGERAMDFINQRGQLIRTKEFEIITKDFVKKLRNTSDKRIALDDGSYQTIPYGTVLGAVETEIELPEDFMPCR